MTEIKYTMKEIEDRFNENKRDLGARMYMEKTIELFITEIEEIPEIDNGIYRYLKEFKHNTDFDFEELFNYIIEYTILSYLKAEIKEEKSVEDYVAEAISKVCQTELFYYDLTLQRQLDEMYDLYLKVNEKIEKDELNEHYTYDEYLNHTEYRMYLNTATANHLYEDYKKMKEYIKNNKGF